MLQGPHDGVDDGERQLQLVRTLPAGRGPDVQQVFQEEPFDLVGGEAGVFRGAGALGPVDGGAGGGGLGGLPAQQRLDPLEQFGEPGGGLRPGVRRGGGERGGVEAGKLVARVRPGRLFLGGGEVRGEIEDRVFFRPGRGVRVESRGGRAVGDGVHRGVGLGADGQRVLLPPQPGEELRGGELGLRVDGVGDGGHAGRSRSRIMRGDRRRYVTPGGPAAGVRRARRVRGHPRAGPAAHHGQFVRGRTRRLAATAKRRGPNRHSYRATVQLNHQWHPHPASVQTCQTPCIQLSPSRWSFSRKTVPSP